MVGTTNRQVKASFSEGGKGVINQYLMYEGMKDERTGDEGTSVWGTKVRMYDGTNHLMINA